MQQLPIRIPFLVPLTKEDKTSEKVAYLYNSYKEYRFNAVRNALPELEKYYN